MEFEKFVDPDEGSLAAIQGKERHWEILKTLQLYAKLVQEYPHDRDLRVRYQYWLDKKNSFYAKGGSLHAYLDKIQPVTREQYYSGERRPLFKKESL